MYSSRVSLILLIFFLLPTIVSSIGCYTKVRGSPVPSSCNPLVLNRCYKQVVWDPVKSVKPIGESYECAYEYDPPDGWTYGKSHEIPGVQIDVYYCSTELCNSPSVLPPIPPKLSQRAAPQRSPSRAWPWYWW